VNEGETTRGQMIILPEKVTKAKDDNPETFTVEVVRVEKGPEPARSGSGDTFSLPVMSHSDSAPGPKPEHVGSADMTPIERGPQHADGESGSVPVLGVKHEQAVGETISVPQSVVESTPKPLKRKRTRRTITYTE
jgi:hypothetical protein